METWRLLRAHVWRDKVLRFWDFQENATAVRKKSQGREALLPLLTQHNGLGNSHEEGENANRRAKYVLNEGFFSFVSFVEADARLNAELRVLC